MAVINESVRRILRKKFELGLFADPFLRCDSNREKATVYHPDHLKAARELAARSMVLLKNEKNILPLKPGQKIALLGPLADAGKEMMGAWCAGGEWERNITLLKAMRESAWNQGMAFQKGCEITDSVRTGWASALQAAKTADIVVCAMGEAAWQSGEASSRSDIRLPGIQEQFLAEVKKMGKPVVVVLFNGRPLDLTAILPHTDAILEAWFPGTMAGYAVMDVLSGLVNPSGKLTMTFPRSVGQVPIYYNMKNTGRPFDPNSKYTSKYLDIPNEPLFPFGFGLSYSLFAYSGPELSKNILGQGDSLKVKVKVTNNSEKDGEEIVQLYIRDLAATVTRPVKELKGFSRILVPARQTREVAFWIKQADLAFFDENMQWKTEPGRFQVMTGGNSRDVQIAEFELK